MEWLFSVHMLHGLHVAAPGVPSPMAQKLTWSHCWCEVHPDLSPETNLHAGIRDQGGDGAVKKERISHLQLSKKDIFGKLVLTYAFPSF